MTSEVEARLAEIRAQADAATAGPWTLREDHDDEHDHDHVDSPSGPVAMVHLGDNESESGPGRDSRFIAHARSDVPWLLEQLAAAHVALSKINKIRNSIVGSQSLNWSEHAYPLVAALNAAGVEGLPYPEGRANIGTLLERLAQAEAKLAASEAGAAQMREALEDMRAGRQFCASCTGARGDHFSDCLLITALATDAGKGWTSPEKAEEMRASVKWLEEKCQPLLDLEDDLELAAHVACGLVFDLARGPLESECAFCRARGLNNEETIRAHLLACEKHPYSALAKEAERLREEIADLKLVVQVERDFTQAIASGELKQEDLDAAFARHFPAQALAVGFVSPEECARRVSEAVNDASKALEDAGYVGVRVILGPIAKAKAEVTR